MSNKNLFCTNLEFNYSNANFATIISNLCPIAHLGRIKTIITSFMRDIQQTDFDLEIAKFKVLIHNTNTYTPTQTQNLFASEKLVYAGSRDSSICIYLEKSEDENIVFVDLYFPDYDMSVVKFRKC